MIRKILITGGLGYLGSNIYNRLKNIKDNEITIIDNMSNSSSEINSKILIKDDIRNKEIVNALVRKSDIIIHTAANISVNKSIEDPIIDAENNINGTLNLLEASRKNKIKKFIYISSAAVYGIPKELPIKEEHITNPISPYGLSKLTGERYSMLYHNLYNLPVVVFRPFNIYGPKNKVNDYSGVITKFINKINDNKSPIIYGNGEQTRDFVYLDDVVDIIISTLDNDYTIGKIFNIGTGEQTKIKELADQIIKISKKDLKVEYKGNKLGDIKDSYADIDKLVKILDYIPKYSLEEGLKKCM